jgi:hypothetical protein
VRGLSFPFVEEEAKEAANRPRPARQERQQRPDRQTNRRDDGPVLAALIEKGWDSDKFVEGKVVNVLEFGAFVRVDASTVCSQQECQFACGICFTRLTWSTLCFRLGVL